MSARSIAWCVALLAAAWTASSIADVIVYDDMDENAYDGGCSFGGVPADFNFANTAPVHSGTHSIRFTPDNFNAVSWCTPTAYSATTDFSGIRFWVNLGSAGEGAVIDLVLTNAGNQVGSATLDTLNGGPIAPGGWVQVQATFATDLGYGGTFDQIALQDESGAGQSNVYFDDVMLLAPNSLPDEIFKGNFEATSAAGTIQIDHNATACIGNLVTERYTWVDAIGRTRAATFSHNDTATNAQREGELCEYTYHTDAVNVRDVKSLDGSGAGGFGYIVSHLADTTPADLLHQDDSPLGLAFTGTFDNLLNGRHHAILRYRLNYPRDYCTARDGGGNCTAAATYQMPVTIDWLITTGRNHPLWSVSFDLSGAPANAIDADTRAPYGDMAFDGAANGGFGDTVMGVAWGDHYKFTSTGASPVTFNSSWDWSQLNTIPYVYLWTQNVDAEMGIVQSEDITKQDAGGYFGQFSWTRTSANGQACDTTATQFSPGHPLYLMPCDFNWPYQSINYAIDANNDTNDKRLAWGAEFGFLGQTSYSGNDGTTINVPTQRESYSTYVTLGLHSATATRAQITQVENAMSSTLSASVGTVPISGPAGVGRSDTRAFQPNGYNRVYGTWEVNAAGGNAMLTLNAAGTGILNPMFIVHNHANALPASVMLDGTLLTADADYFATVDPANADHADTRVWITVNRNWLGSHTLNVQ
jgi:hypothetical protein